MAMGRDRQSLKTRFLSAGFARHVLERGPTLATPEGQNEVLNGLAKLPQFPHARAVSEVESAPPSSQAEDMQQPSTKKRKVLPATTGGAAAEAGGGSMPGGAESHAVVHLAAAAAMPTSYSEGCVKRALLALANDAGFVSMVHKALERAKGKD